MSELYEKSLYKLELDKVLEQLADCAGSEIGKESCRNLRPVSDLEEVQILPEYHRKASFLPRLWKFLLQALPVSPAYVEAFVHPQNTYSISLLTKLGMECIDHREYDHYQGNFSPSIRRK